jgi:hypothetical protein
MTIDYCMQNSTYRTGYAARGFALRAHALQYPPSLQRMPLGASLQQTGR